MITVNQMRTLMESECQRYECCSDNGGCPLINLAECDFDAWSDERVEEAFTKMFGTPCTEDIINHPSHYCREGGMECLDEMELIFGKEALKHFCLCNAWKYRYRASAKNGDEDLKKSDFYMKKYKELSANG